MKTLSTLVIYNSSGVSQKHGWCLKWNLIMAVRTLYISIVATRDVNNMVDNIINK